MSLPLIPFDLSSVLPNGVSGNAWVSDYGNPHNAHDFDFIYPISPLHNVPADKVLPPVLLMTADRTYKNSSRL